MVVVRCKVGTDLKVGMALRFWYFKSLADFFSEPVVNLTMAGDGFDNTICGVGVE